MQRVAAATVRRQCPEECHACTPASSSSQYCHSILCNQVIGSLPLQVLCSDMDGQEWNRFRLSEGYFTCFSRHHPANLAFPRVCPMTSSISAKITTLSAESRSVIGASTNSPNTQLIQVLRISGARRAPLADNRQI